MNDAPRVLSIVWNLIRGGTEGQCARVSMALAGKGIAARVAVFRKEGFFLQQVEETCGRVYHFDTRRLVSADSREKVRRLAEYLSAERIGVVHAWDADAAIFGSEAARAAGIPLITSRRDLGEIYPWYKLWLMRRADRRARAVVTNAAAISDRVAGQGVPREKIVCVPNILDVDEFDALAGKPLPPEINLEPGRWIGMVSRLDPEKDGLTFAGAAIRVARAMPEARFVVAGDGPDRAAMERMARDAEVADRFRFLGDVTCVPALLRRLSVGALVPRANEGQSNTILEYMAAGLPVVATDCGGNKELVENGRTGLVLRAGDVDGIASAIAGLARDESRAKAMGREGRARVMERHRPGAVAAHYEALYKRVAN